MKSNAPLFIIVDLFCGFGGTSRGFADAEIDGVKIAKVIAAVNHDPNAIKSHWMNHKDVKHFEEDIRTLNLKELIALVAKYRKLYPQAKLILWASLECTNFSKAKGGGARDADSRTLAEHLYRYVAALTPDYIQIENVVEFMSWGALDQNGKPVSRDKGKSWMRWRKHICKFGYRDEWKQINSADLGAYTSRNRLFGCFAAKGLPIIWPEATHSKKATGKNDMFGSSLQQWKPVKEVLDFNDEGVSIFTRKKPLSEKTLERVYAGLVKFVAKGDSSFMLKYNSMNQSGVHTPPSIHEPCPTIAAQARLGLVQANFLAAYYGTGDNVSSVSNPCPVIPTKDRFQLVQPQHFILNPSHGGNNTSTDKPCPVIVARQDKAPLYLVQCPTGNGNVQVEIYADDTEAAIKIKKFMVAYELVDVKMRMLKVPELLLIQGLTTKEKPEYHMTGSQTDQKKFIGNSVHPFVPKAWAEAMGSELLILKIAA